MKCAIITGGSRGIGKAICLKLAEEHQYHLLINYHSNEVAALETLQEVNALGGTGEILKFDVANTEEVKKVLTDWTDNNKEAIVE
ncbi:SDR family NAD(P)-dependent oxidoreductase, partial [Algoriella sp.]